MFSKKISVFRVFLSLALIVYLLLTSCAHAAGAFPDVIPAGKPIPAPAPINAYSSKSVYYETQPDGSAIARVGYPPSMSWLTGVPDVTASSLSATSANPDGYVAKVSGTAPVLESAVSVASVPPAGATPSTATAAAAAGMAGVGVATASLVKSVALGGGAGSLAVKLGMTAIGGVIGVLNSPVVVAGLTGYALYQAIKGQGVTVLADGSAVVAGASHYVWCSGYAGSGSCVATVASVPTSAECVILASVDPIHLTVGYAGAWAAAGGCQAQNTSGFPYFGYWFPGIGNNGLVSGASVPATNSDLLNAMNAATAAAAVAADAANLAIQRGYALPANLPSTSPAVSVASPFAETKSLTDALGNVTKTLERNTLALSPTSGGSAPSVDARREVVQLVNAAPQSVQSTSLAPTIAQNTATVLANSAQQKTTDLCIDHPDITACSDMSSASSVPDVALKTKDINLAITPVSVGSGLASCPPPLTLMIPYFNRTVTLDGSKWACDAASLMKPLNISLAWLGAGFILMGGIRKNA